MASTDRRRTLPWLRPAALEKGCEWRNAGTAEWKRGWFFPLPPGSLARQAGPGGIHLFCFLTLWGRTAHQAIAVLSWKSGAVGAMRGPRNKERGCCLHARLHVPVAWGAAAQRAGEKEGRSQGAAAPPSPSNGWCWKKQASVLPSPTRCFEAASRFSGSKDPP